MTTRNEFLMIWSLVAGILVTGCASVPSRAAHESELTMNISEFASMTRRVIQRDGIDGYLPTLCIPRRRLVSVLEGAPDASMEETKRAALDWANNKTEPGEDYFLAFKESATSFRIVHRHDGNVEEESFLANSE